MACSLSGGENAVIEGRVRGFLEVMEEASIGSDRDLVWGVRSRHRVSRPRSGSGPELRLHNLGPRHRAVREFTVPPGRTGPAIMEIDVPAGVPAIWVPPFSLESLPYQRELILDRRIRIATGRRRVDGVYFGSRLRGTAVSRFIGDAKDLRQPGEPRLLAIASDLLDELGVFDCERDVQQRAVSGWLQRNEPNQVLAISLPRPASSARTCQTTCQTNHDGRSRTGPDQRHLRVPETRMIPDVGGPDVIDPDRARRSHNPKVVGSNPTPATI